MRNIDIWRTKREQAHTMPCGLKVLRETVNGSPVVVIWRPRATKPYVNTRFRSVADRQKYVRQQVVNFKVDQKVKAEFQQQRRGTPEDLEKVTPGMIFVSSWGYDQTNVDFYQVIERRGRQVLLREIAAERVPGSDHGFMSDQCVAKKDAFLNKPAFKKLLRFRDDKKPYVVIESFAHAYPWDGRPTHRSWYA